MKYLIKFMGLYTLGFLPMLITTLLEPIPAFAQTKFPIKIIVLYVASPTESPNFMGAEFTVPDRNTTVSAGGGLRRYDAHIAKMFELTYYECRQQQGQRDWQGIAWGYRAGNGDIEMGIFEISCNLARDVAQAYGFRGTEATEVYYYRVNEVINVPSLDITGGKVQKWLNFVQDFKPVFKN